MDTPKILAPFSTVASASAALNRSWHPNVRHRTTNARSPYAAGKLAGPMRPTQVEPYHSFEPTPILIGKLTSRILSIRRFVPRTKRVSDTV